MSWRCGRHSPALMAWLAGLQASLPIAMGYLPVSVAFGMAARGAGLGELEGVLTSAVVFAGASQFALVGLLGTGEAPALAALTALALNVRHVLYGPVLAPLLRGCSRAWQALLAFGLTDEVFAAAAARLGTVPEGARRHWLLGLATGAYATWVLGTWLGTAGGSVLVAFLPRVGPALAFSLPVLFLVLLLPLLRGSAAVSAAAAALVTLPLHATGRTGLGLLVGAATGIAAGLAWERLVEARHGPGEGGSGAVDHRRHAGGRGDVPAAAATPLDRQRARTGEDRAG